MPSWLKSSCLCFQSKETNVVIASKDMISELPDSILQVASKEDMISELPDSILQDEILSRLPTKLAVSTSILSKRWRWLWTGVPALELSYIAGDESDHHKAAMFMNYVDNALLHHQFSKLRSFKLSYTDNCCTSRLPSWIFTVAHLNLHEIYLDIHIQDSNVIPMVFFHCQSLKVLSISAELLEALPHRDLMRILPTHANLTSLRIIRQCSGRNLLSFLRIMPNIEELIFDEAYAFSEADLTSHIIEMLPKCLHSRIKKVQINEFNGCSSQFIKFLLTYVAGFEITDVIDAKTVSSSSVKIVTMKRHSLKPSHPLSLQDLFSHALGPPTYSSEDDE